MNCSGTEEPCGKCPRCWKAQRDECRSRIKYANTITCRALRNICEDNHPTIVFDRECAWCIIKLALNMKEQHWRADRLTDAQVADLNPECEDTDEVE